MRGSQHTTHSDTDLALILAAFDRTRRYHLRASAGFAAAAVLVTVVAVARDFWWLGLLGAGLFGGLAVVGWRLGTTVNDPRRSVVLAALLERPEDITQVRHHIAQSTVGWFKTHWIRLNTRDGKVAGIRVDKPEVPALAEALANQCPDADVQVPGYAREKPD
jgi:hypothetical protein